jgi:hypothetical protein
MQTAALASRQNRQKDKKAKARKAEGLFKQAEECVRLLLKNPRHPSFNTHEFDSIANPYDGAAKVFEAYAQNRTPGAYRLFWCYGRDKGEITMIAITPIVSLWARLSKPHTNRNESTISLVGPTQFPG